MSTPDAAWLQWRETALRLQSDDWLKRAAEEIESGILTYCATDSGQTLGTDIKVLDILKKHRGDLPPVCA